MNNGLIAGLERRSPRPARSGPGWPPSPSDREIGLSWYPAPGNLFTWGGNENSSLGTTADREVAYWRVFPVPVKVSTLGVAVTVGAAGSAIRLGIRHVDWATMQPGRLLVDAGTASTTGGGQFELTLQRPLELWGYYFFTMTAQGGAPTVQQAAAMDAWGNRSGAYSVGFPASGWGAWGWYQTGVTGDLPLLSQGTWNAAAFGSGSATPFLVMRRAL